MAVQVAFAYPLDMFSFFNPTRSKTGRYQFAGRLNDHSGAIYALDFSLEGRFLASGGNAFHILTASINRQET
jgi:hypothetical protein